MQALTSLVRTVTEIVFPRRCAGCLQPGSLLLCGTCADSSPPAPIRELTGFETVRSAFRHEGAARDALLAAKLGGERRCARGLAAHLPAVAGYDVVTPVPDAYVSRARRGGSVTASLARRYADRVGLPFEMLLRRPHAGRDLGGASRAERFDAIQGAFLPSRPAPPGVVLVDDVVTTGATALACAAALRAAGARGLALVTFTSADRR